LHNIIGNTKIQFERITISEREHASNPHVLNP
jgi:hypothetical protein